MRQWLEYESTNEYVKQQYGAYHLHIFYNRDDDDVVNFRCPRQATFRRDEAIEILKDILKTLKDE